MFKISTSKAAISESGSSYMGKSGIYPINIKFASVAVSKNGATSINFNVDYNGNSQTLYGPFVADREGKELEIGIKLINKLGIIAGMGEGEVPETELQEHPVGKDNKLQEFKVITNFSDLPCQVRLQEVYSRNPETGEITSRLEIRNFFREDGASAEEIVNGTEIGKRLAMETEKYASNVSYVDSRKNAGDAPTPEEVAEWRAAKAEGKSAPKAAPKAVVSKAKTASLFK